MPEKAGLTAAQGIADMPIQTERKVTDRNQSPSFIFQTSVPLRINCKQTSLLLRIDCKQTSVSIRLLVVVQRAACGEVVDLALDVLQNCLVLFGTFLGDTVDNIGVLCDG